MSLTFQQFIEMVKEVEQDDPVDVTGLSIPIDSYRGLICNNIWDMYLTLWKSLPQEHREAAMMAALAKLVLENFIMHTRIKIAFEEQ